MPNHVRNILTISGKDSEIKRFMDTMNSETNPALKEHYKRCLECRIEISKRLIQEKASPFAKESLDQAEQELASLDKFQTHFSFDATVPQPPELSGTTSPPRGFEIKLQKEYKKKFGAGNWYDWNMKAYGTKWSAYGVGDWYDKEDGVAIDFDTAWSPPDAWLSQTAKLFPELTFVDYWHSEGGECGRLTVSTEDGEVIVDDEPIEEHDWLLENDGMYADEYNMVTQEDYKQAVKDVIESNTPFGWYHNEELFVKRLKPEDLPLFINFEWNDSDAFEEKMKEAL